MAEPYLKKDPGDIIRAQDWNDMQSRARDAIEGHTHTGGAEGPLLTGAAIDPGAALKVKSVTADALSVAGADLSASLKSLLDRVNAALPIAGGTLAGELVARGGLRLPDTELRLRGGADNNHGLGYYGGDRRFAGQAPDGPVLYGFSGGGLGTTNGGQRLALTWDTQQNVSVNRALTVADSIMAGGSDLYFTQTNHTHTGRSNAAGWAGIENASDYNALMILGRAGTTLPNGSTGRFVRVWDYLQVDGDFGVTGNASWGRSMLRSDQGGSIELGGTNQTAGIGTPYIDFHYSGKTEDFNVRLINAKDGELWLQGRLRAFQQVDWQNVTAFSSSWRNYGAGWPAAAYMIDSLGFVHLRGLVAAGSVGFSHTIFVLPVGFRPAVNYLHCISFGAEGSGRIDVYPDGRVVPAGGNNGWFSLDGIIFQAVT